MNDNQLLNLIVGELKEISRELKDQGKTLAGQAEVLKDHTRRSEVNEEGLRLAREEMKPLQRHVAFVDMVLKSCGTLAALAGFILVSLNIVTWVRDSFHF